MTDLDKLAEMIEAGHEWHGEMLYRVVVKRKLLLLAPALVAVARDAARHRTDGTLDDLRRWCPLCEYSAPLHEERCTVGALLKLLPELLGAPDKTP